MLEWKELLYSFQHLFSDNIFWRFDWLEELRQWLDFAPYALKRQSRDWTRVDRCISAIQFYFFKVIHWGLGQLNTKTRSVRVVLLWL